MRWQAFSEYCAYISIGRGQNWRALLTTVPTSWSGEAAVSRGRMRQPNMIMARIITEMTSIAPFHPSSVISLYMEGHHEKQIHI